MEFLLIGFIGALIGGLCLSIMSLTLYYIEKKRVQKETNKIVNEFKQMNFNRTFDNGSKFN